MPAPWEKYAAQPASQPASQPATQYPGVIRGAPAAPDPMEAERLRLQQEASARAAQSEARAQASFEGTGGAGTEAQNKAAVLLGRIQGGFTDIQDLTSSFPEAERPGLSETLLYGSLGPESVIARQTTDWQRRAINDVQRDIVDALLTMGTGAAYNQEQLEAMRVSYFPQYNDTKDEVAYKNRRLLRMIETARLQAGPNAAKLDEALAPLLGSLQRPEAASTQDARKDVPAIGLPPEDMGSPGVAALSAAPERQQFSNNGYRTVSDPAMARVADEYRQRLGSGQSAREILSWLKSQGVSGETLVGAVGQIRYRDQNPDVPISSYKINATKQVPLSSYEEAITNVGSGAAGAYALGAGQFLSGNTLDNLASDPERARNALALSQEGSPNAFGIGEITGGVLAGLTGEAALARLGVASGLGRSVVADAAMGGANAAGAADNPGDSRVSNALLGAGAGALGSVAGQGAVRTASRVIAPTGGSMAPLYQSGVRPTIGQRVADKGFAGNLVSKTEEALQSVPFVGSAIRGARQESRDQFQVGAFNQALAEIGEELPKGMKPGTAPHAFSQRLFDKVYDEARSGMMVRGDDVLQRDIQSLTAQVDELPEPSANRFRAILKNTVMGRMKGDALEGDAYKRVYSDLGKRIASIRNNPNGDFELADALQDLQGHLDSAARRHSDPASVELLDAADAGYAKLVRIEEASKAYGGDAGTFTPNQFDRSVQKTQGGIRSKSYLRGDALMQDYAEAGRGLSDTLPNSGTADRVMAGYAVGAPVAGGAAFFEPTTAMALGTIGGAYAPGVRTVQQRLLAPGGPKAQAIAERLRKRARLIGAATSAAGVQGTLPSQ